MVSSVERRVNLVTFDRQKLTTYPSDVAICDGMVYLRLPAAAQKALTVAGVAHDALRFVGPNQKSNTYAALPVEFKRDNGANKIRQLVLDCASIQAVNNVWDIHHMGLGLFYDGDKIDVMFAQTLPVRTSV